MKNPGLSRGFLLDGADLNLEDPGHPDPLIGCNGTGESTFLLRIAEEELQSFLSHFT